MASYDETHEDSSLLGNIMPVQDENNFIGHRE